MLSSIAEIIRDLLIFIIVMAALLISNMPDSHPTTCDVAMLSSSASTDGTCGTVY